MSLMDGVLGGLVSAGVTSMIAHVIQEHGGVQGIVTQLEQNGLGNVAKSWVGNGMNQPITANQILQALGPDTIKTIAGKLGLDPEQVAAQLAEHLPTAVDKMTPEGAVPAAA